MSHDTRSRALPLAPLLATYRGTRGSAHPRPAGLSVEFLDSASNDELAARLREVSEAMLPVAYHTALVSNRVRFLRHALNHLFRGADPLPDRLARCATPGEAYFVAGVGAGLWSVLAACVEPARVPRWGPAVERGLLRLGILREIAADARTRFDAVCRACEVVREHAPDLTPAEIDDFLERVSRTTGRELPPTSGPLARVAANAHPLHDRRAGRDRRPVPDRREGRRV